MPSLGYLLGTHVSGEIFDQINTAGHASFFGSEFDQMEQEFSTRYIKPMERISVDLDRTVNALLNPDQFRILQSVEDFRSIPPCMEMAICLLPPVRKAMEEGRMTGFDWRPDTLPDEDFFGRMIDNFSCTDVAAASDENGYYDISAIVYSDDPDYTDDELHAVEMTRDYILRKILGETDRDPTDIDQTRG